MSFPENTPPLLPPDDVLAGWPADAAAEPADVQRADVQRAWAQRLFRRYEWLPMRPSVRYALHLGLFLLTLFTTTLAGVAIVRQGPEWLAFDVFGLPAAQRGAQLGWGLLFAGPFLAVLAVHEFGHYFVARYNQVRTSLPYFLPVPFGLGTFGAVIRIKERIFSRREFFDIGVAGPLAGLLVAVPLLAYAFAHLPEPVAYLFGLRAPLAHYAPPELTLARPLLYQLLEKLFADPSRVPPPNQLLHYPLLLAGEMSLFFTALNLLPIGQLDGGHLLYGLLGPRRAGRLSALLFVAFIFYAGLGLFSVDFLGKSGPARWNTSGTHWLYWGLPYAAYLAAVFWRLLPRPWMGLAVGAAVWAGQVALATQVPGTLGQPGWLVFGLLLGRLSGIYHPGAPDETPLSRGRQVLGWIMVVLFVLCFSPSPLIEVHWAAI